MTYSELENELSGALEDIKKERAELGDLKEIVGRFGSKSLGSFPALDRKLEDRLCRIICEMNNT